MNDIKKDNPLRAEKRRKLGKLRELGINPYPYSFDRTASIAEIRAKYGETPAATELKEEIHQIAGRLMAMRTMGKSVFFNIQDQSGTLQVYIKPSALPEKQMQAFDLLDLGDIVGVKGFIFKTKTGELSLHADYFEMLTKTLEPLPEKFHGIADPEIKYRYRHLDLITDKDSRKVFETRSKIITGIRNFLNERGFLEVETPVLQPIYGGASANPFQTNLRALDMTLYMKISPELYLKRLIVGGFEKVYDLGKNFRNEGIDRTHNPEFTMVEWYEAYTDYNYQMKQFEDLVAKLAKDITGSTKVTYQDKEIDFTTPWRRLTVYDGLREYAKIEPNTISEQDLLNELKKHDKDAEMASKGEMLMELFEHVVEQHLWQPTFVMDHPEEISPLTKKHRTQTGLVERFEPFAACMELGNSYSELNDPEDQYERLKTQEAKRVVDEEAQPMDEDFMHAIDVGMPPTGGVGLGVERIVMLLTNSSTIRDIILFPTMKHKN